MTALVSAINQFNLKISHLDLSNNTVSGDTAKIASEAQAASLVETLITFVQEQHHLLSLNLSGM